MSLDKQRILSELGSVMNQLQSADCGCMGKLFNSNQGQGGQPTMGSPLPTCGGCRRGWCQGHGYGRGMPNAGEPYQANPSINMNRPCMGHCNPPKLYADTYNYLNNNLMQPVVQEVYDDLKSITPQNTIMNSPVAGQMGMPNNAGNAGMNMTPKESTGANMNQMQMSGMGAGNMGNQMQNMAGMGAGNMHSMPMQQGQQPMSNMGGMGPDIAKMILGEGGAKQSSPQNMSGQGGQLTGSMLIDAPQSPHGQVGVIPLNQTAAGHMNANMNQGQYTPNAGTFAQNPTMQYMSQAGSAANAQNMPLQGNAVQNPGNAQMGNPAAQQMAAPNQRQYGQHTQGVMKFNEMFPGVMQGGDLGFDPMAIAIQMNPANQQKAAMETMQKLMNGNKAGNVTQPAAPPANLAKPQQYTNQQVVSPVQNQQMQPGQQQMQPGQQQMQPGQQVIDNSNAGAMPTQHSAVQPQQQQVYTAVTGNQQQLYQQSETQPQQNQNMIDPNTGAPVMPGNEVMSQPNAQMQQQPAVPQSETPAMQQMIKEPIFPADNSRNQTYHYARPQKNYEYNTLGQPVQMLPAQLFHPPEPSLPQTLSPQPITTKLRNDPTKYSNVKSTVSKTSIMGNKQLGKGISKSQLQHIYNQYKGSQSYTQQNLPPTQAPTHSDGKLNVTKTNAAPQRQVPVEKVGGDTIANNPRVTEKVEQVLGQVGDVPASNKPHGDMEPLKAASAIPERQAKLRNGLQDVVYTSYPSSAAWSFHGANDHRPIAVGYRFREFK